jgi:hypothetical protein
MSGPRLGSLVSAVAGLVFVLLNAGRFDGPVGVVLRLLGVAVFAVVTWYAVLRRSAGRPGPGPAPGALRTYLICVAGEVVAIPLGAQLLSRVLDQPQLTPAWVVLVVGVHFLPFARAFRAPPFRTLGLTLIGLALLGGVLALTVTPLAVPGAAVAAGFVLLAFAALGATRPGPVSDD